MSEVIQLNSDKRIYAAVIPHKDGRFEVVGSDRTTLQQVEDTIKYLAKPPHNPISPTRPIRARKAIVEFID